MKKLFLLSVLLVAVSCNMEKGYTIKGTVTGDEKEISSGEVILHSRDLANPIIDTVKLINGHFTFKGKVTTPDTYYISIKGAKGKASLFLENADYTVEGSFDNLRKATVTGGETQTILNEIAALQTKIDEELGDTKVLVEEYRSEKTTEERKEEIIKLFDSVEERMDAFKDSILKANPVSFYSLQEFQKKVYDMDIEEAKVRFEEFKNEAKFEGNNLLAKLEETISKLEKLQIGQPAPEFKLNTPEGKELALSEVYKANKITMIDFWAGWCNPCRKFNPILKNIYTQYHKKGFEVLGVSLDRDRETWLKAIKDDKLPWLQVSDIKYWESEPAKMYAIRYIPQNVFVDQNGNILARKLSEEDIVKFLEEHLK